MLNKCSEVKDACANPAQDGPIKLVDKAKAAG